MFFLYFSYCCFQTIYKRLYKNSGREKGTLRFFREKLNRRNVTVDVKHYEDCEQLFFSVCLCFVVEALLEFFQMSDAKQKPTANGPHSVYCLTEAYHKSYVNDILDKFMHEFVLIGDDDMSLSKDGIWCYGVMVLTSFGRFWCWQILRMLLPLSMVNTCLPLGNSCWFTFFQILVLMNFQLKCSLTSCSAMFCCQKLKLTAVSGLLQLIGQVVPERTLKLTYFKKIEMPR